MVLKVVFTLLPEILKAIKEENQKQVGRDQVFQAVMKRFEDVNKRAEDARKSASNAVDNGLSDDEYRRD